MYQDKIKKEAKKAIEANKNDTRQINIFESAGLEPLIFIPDEDVCDATHIARDILFKRSNEDVILLSKAIDSLLSIGENLLQNLSLKLIKNSTSRKSVVLTQGRALYLLCDYFELSTLKIKNLQWSDMFATLTLMQSAEILYLSSRNYNEDEFFSKALKQTAEHCIRELKEETIDSIARSECLFDKKELIKSSGGAGGKAKSKKMEALKVEVIRRYMKDFDKDKDSNKSAGEIIEAELMHEKSPLLNLSESEEKNLLFAKWIGAFNNGNWKMPL